MSKPLTVEELKALPVGDWVWVVDMYGKETESAYTQIIGTDLDGLTLPTDSMNWEYPDYGTSWIAYRNKEQAEAKGEIVELPCEEMYRVIPNTQSNDFNDEPTYRVLKYKIIAISIDGKKYLVESAGWQGKQNQRWTNASEFMTKSQAEARLKELKGESV